MHPKPLAVEAFISKVDVMIYFLGISQPLSPAPECSLSRFMKLVALAGGGGREAKHGLKTRACPQLAECPTFLHQ